MSQDALTQGSARPYRRRRPRAANDKKITDDEFMAAAIGDVEWLKQSLRDQKQGDINYDKNGLTALHLAAIHGRLDCLKLLIERHKFGVDLASSTGWRAAHLCISNQTGRRAVQCLQYLLDRKADASIANDDGITPIHQAASEGHVQCLKMLIDSGARIDGEDCRSHTPLDLAKLWGHRRCARIIAAEMWQQGKENVAKEMSHLRRMRMQQVLREMELEAQFRATHGNYSEAAFRQWLDTQQGLDSDRHTGQKSGRKEKMAKKEKIQTDSLMKPNSVAAKNATKTEKEGRRADTIPPQKVARAASPVSRRPTNLTNLTYVEEEEFDDGGLYEFPPGGRDEAAERSRSPGGGFYNPEPWRIPLRVSEPPYMTNLTDDYPRDEYTKMPQVESAPKYFDGKFGPRHYKDEIKNVKIDTKKKMRKPNLPKEVIDNGLRDDPTKQQRPVLFKAKHISDVHARKKYDDEVTGRSQISLHLCDDTTSFLFKNSLSQAPTKLGLAGKERGSRRDESAVLRSKPGTSRSSGSTVLLSHAGTQSLLPSDEWSSVKFPREKVINSLHSIGKPAVFPYIKGEEYDLRTGTVGV